MNVSYKCLRSCASRELDATVYNAAEVKGWFNMLSLETESPRRIEAESNGAPLLHSYDPHRILGICALYRHVKWESEGKGKLEEVFVPGSVGEGPAHTVRLPQRRASTAASIREAGHADRELTLPSARSELREDGAWTLLLSILTTHRSGLKYKRHLISGLNFSQERNVPKIDLERPENQGSVL